MEQCRTNLEPLKKNQQLINMAIIWQNNIFMKIGGWVPEARGRRGAPVPAAQGRRGAPD